MSTLPEWTVWFPMLLPVVLAVVWHITSRGRRAEERVRGTHRLPVVATSLVGWFPMAIGAHLLISGTFTVMADGPVPSEGTSAEFEMTLGAVHLIVGAAIAFGMGRRRVTIWGEQVRYRPYFAADRTIWAMEAVRAERMTTRTNTTFWVTRLDGRTAHWDISAFPQRTITAFRHGTHRNEVEGAAVRTPIHGMDPFTKDETLQMPDGTVATWNPGRTVQLDVLASTAHEHLLETVEDRLATVFTPLPGARSQGRVGGDAHRGSVYRADIEWTRRPGTTAIDVRIRAEGERGLSDAGGAYSWFRSQLVQGARAHLRVCDAPVHERERAGDVFTITYRETWS